MCIRKYCWNILKFISVIALGILFFVITADFQQHKPIEELSNTINISGNQFSLASQDYELDNIEKTLINWVERHKYEICFSNEGSRIIESAFESNLIVLVNYAGKEIEIDNEFCLDIADRTNITWSWTFTTTSEMTNSFLNIKDFQNLIIEPHVKTYFKVKPLYYLFTLLLNIFYAGIFLLAIEGIWTFIKK